MALLCVMGLFSVYGSWTGSVVLQKQQRGSASNHAGTNESLDQFRMMGNTSVGDDDDDGQICRT